MPFARRAPHGREVSAGHRGPGHIHLFVVVAGAPSNVATLDGFIEAIGADLRTVTLARAACGGEGPDVAEDDLAAAALFVSSTTPRLVVLADGSLPTLHRAVIAERARLVVVLDDPAGALALRRMTARNRIRVIGASIRSTPRRHRRR